MSTAKNLRSNRSEAVLDIAHQRLLAVDSHLNSILAVDLTTGARTVFSAASTTPDAADVLSIPRAITLDAAHNRALILDTGRKAILAADLDTGARTVIYEYANQAPRRIFNPTQILMHPSFGYLLLLDNVTKTLAALDLSGAQPQVVTLTR